MVSLGVRGSTIPTTLLEFRCAPVGTGTALVRKPTGIYWVEDKNPNSLEEHSKRSKGESGAEVQSE